MGALPDLRVVLSGSLRDSRVRVRPATSRDAGSLARLRYAFRADFDPTIESELEFLPRCQAWMAARLSSSGLWHCWVAESAQHLVGMVWLQLIEKLPNPVEESEWHGYVSSLYVDPAWRSVGLGSALLNDCLKECAAREVDAVILWPTPRSRTLYERHGFAVRDDLMEKRSPPAVTPP